MPRLLIDANIYLTLFQTHTVRKLLPALVKAAADIFVSRQIVDEVQRNKLAIASQYLKQHVAGVAVSGAPDLLLLGLASDRAAEKALTAGYENVTKFRERLDDLAQKQLELISKSADEISKLLAPVFARAVEATFPQLERARNRREVGNPPGKPDDPLGDQLTWEQFLDAVKPGETVWIVTNDRDYVLRESGYALLHARLYDDLKARGVTDVRAFDKLSEALTELAKSAPQESALPDRKTLEKIKEEEKKAVSASDLSFRPRLYSFTDWIAPVSTVLIRRSCPRCGSAAIKTEQAEPGEGEWTEQLRCDACGNEWQTVTAS